MEGNTSQIDRSESSFSSREIAARFMIQSYLNTIKYRFQDDPTIYEQFIEFTQNFQEDGDISSKDLKMIVDVLFGGHDDLIQEYHDLRPTFEEARTFHMERKREEAEKEVREMKKIADARQRDHIRACEVQSKSALLRLPREIRDTIWKDVVSGNIVHISRDVESSSYCYHSCVAPNGLKSSACPSGEGDHAQCATTGRSDFPSYRLICKQINLELPDARGTFFSKSAFHFDDLVDAEEYLFGLKERDRAAITHLRLPIPYSLSTKHEDSGPEFQAWEAIMNYFSCPWARETLNLDVHDRHNAQYLKQPWYFYYSSCYYHQNRHRMYKNWQIGFGSTSWDMDIASLRYKAEPKLDIGMNYPASAQSIFRPHDHYTPSAPFPTDLDNHPQWLRSLLQFRQYSGLNFHFWNEDGVTNVDRHEDFIHALRERISRSEIGPWKVVEFRGGRFENPDGHSLRFL
ncbi:hypothetical protein EAF04_007250 [Stromatinia cepivora]|nr:hypothetical protein EAF04_007250 [Stromatinia cepivora]